MSDPTLGQVLIWGVFVCLTFNLLVGLVVCLQQAKLSWDRKRFSYKVVQRIVADSRRPKDTKSNTAS
jgi:hypothetical protein